MTAAADTERGPEAPLSDAARSRRHRGFVFGSPAAIVFGGAPGSWSHVVASSGVASLILYGLAGWGLSRAEWQREPRVVAPPMVVELLPPPPPPPPPAAPEPEPPPPPPEPPPVVKPSKVVERVVEKAPPPAEPPPEPSNEPPPPAEAGQVVAADAPADFTNFDIATGQGRFRGGVTASSGTNTRAVHSAVVDRTAAPGSGGNVSLAQPVRLEVRNWVCPWPEQADLLAVDEERVVLKVDVDAQGRVTAASVVSDPGYGFGAAALRCARQHRFLPATDVAGRPIAASSPPIRVRFSR